MDNRQTQANLHYLIKLAGTSFSEIDREFGLYRGAANQSLREPIEQAEKAIIAVLRVKLGESDPRIHPKKLWPRRYHDDGTRLPQEALVRDYRNAEGRGPRQKAVEA